MDEATLRIKIEDEGPSSPSQPQGPPPPPRPPPPPAGASSPPPPVPPTPGPAPAPHPAAPQAAPGSPIDYEALAREHHEREMQHARLQAAYENLYEGVGRAQRVGKEIPGTLDTIANIAGKMRGTLGGIFGQVAGAGLDILAAFREIRKNQAAPEPERATRKLAFKMPKTAAPGAPAPPASPAAAPPDPQQESIFTDLASALQGLGNTKADAKATVDRLRQSGVKFQDVQDALKSAFGQTPTPGAPAPSPTAPPTTAAPQPPPAAPQPAPQTIGPREVYGAPIAKAPPNAAPSPAPPPVTPAAAPYGAPPVPPAAPIAEAAGGAEAGGAMAGMAAAGAAIPIAGAVIAALAAIKGALTGAVRALGDFASAVASPDANPSQALQQVGSAASSAGDKLFYLSPIVGIVVSTLGEAVNALGKVMANLDALGERYGQYSPGIAQAQAMNDIRQVMGDMRRAREVEPAMVRYLQVRGDLQQKIEDVKMRILVKILPLVEGIMKFVEAGVDGVDGLLMILDAIKDAVNLMRDPLGIIATNTEKEGKEQEIESAYDIITKYKIREPSGTLGRTNRQTFDPNVRLGDVS